jgi:membrane associated rhomboid family serine protease
MNRTDFEERIIQQKRHNSRQVKQQRYKNFTYENERQLRPIQRPYKKEEFVITANLSLSVSLIIIIIYALYKTTIFKNVPCNNDIVSILSSNFIHTDGAHLIANLYGMYAVSNIETSIGTENFVWLFVFILAFSTLFEYIIRQTFDTKCSIGISGILMGLLTWNIIISNKVNGKHNLESIIAIVVLVGYPSIKCKNTSFVGHLVGSLAGFVATIFYKRKN